jgi:D-glycero-D-manno-heptose 1,7-bisphosphate phosphatase
MSRRVAFLDRDGTLNADHGYVHRVADWEFLEGAVEAVAALRAQGFAIAVVTNQSGVALGYFTREDVRALHEHVQRELARLGAGIDALAFCPHAATDQCDCRKPRTGMGRSVERQLGEPIDYPASWTIGDKLSDIEFGAALGTRTALLRSRYWSPGDLTRAPDLLADSLLEAARRIAAPAIARE